MPMKPGAIAGSVSDVAAAGKESGYSELANAEFKQVDTRQGGMPGVAIS